MESTPQTAETSEEKEKREASEAKAKHDQQITELKARVEDAKSRPPEKASEKPPTEADLLFIDRLRKARTYDRDYFMLGIMLGHKPESLSVIQAMMAVIEHQHNQDRYAQEVAVQAHRDITKARTKAEDLEKAMGEEMDSLRTRINEVESRHNDRLAGVDDQNAYALAYVRSTRIYLTTLEEWRSRSWLWRLFHRKERPKVPDAVPFETFTACRAEVEDLPGKLRKAAEATVDLATRVAEAGQKDCEACERKRIEAEAQEYKNVQDGMRSYNDYVKRSKQANEKDDRSRQENAEKIHNKEVM